jgi:hypothetical protein
LGDVAEKALQRVVEAPKESKVAELSTQYADQVWLRGLVQLIPYAGGALDTWMGGAAAEAQKTHVEEFIAKTAEHFTSLEDSVVNREFLQSEEFFRLFQGMLTRASKTHDQAKIDLLSQAFSRAAVSNVDAISRDSMIDIIDHLSPAHILVLRTLVATEPTAHYVTVDQASGQPDGGFMHASARWIIQNHSELRALIFLTSSAWAVLATRMM